MFGFEFVPATNRPSSVIMSMQHIFCNADVIFAETSNISVSIIAMKIILQMEIRQYRYFITTTMTEERHNRDCEKGTL